MPVITTTASLSKYGYQASGITPLVGNQYIFSLQITPFTGFGGVIVDRRGFAYTLTDSTMGFTKISATGAIVFQRKSLNGDAVVTAIDSARNIYAAGADTAYGLILVKYNTVGTIVWQRGITFTSPTFQTGTIVAMVVDLDDNIYIACENNDTSPGPFQTWIMKFDKNGNLLVQKELLVADCFIKQLHYDKFNNSLIVGGTYSPGLVPSLIYNGKYDTSLNNVSNNILAQASSTDDYFLDTPGIPFASDGSYVYQINNRVIGGITKDCLTKIDYTTGAVIYSYEITYLVNSYALAGVILDKNNFLYTAGRTVNGLYIGKWDTSGTPVWEKTITINAGYTIAVDSLYELENFVYFGLSVAGPNGFNATLKLNKDGSLPDGTYTNSLINYTFTSISSTLNNLLPSAAGTNTGVSITTSYATATSTISTINTTYPVATTVLP